MAGPEVLLVKLSSLGDVVHAFPAVSDAKRAWPALRIDWAVDEAFADLPALHPGVRRVISLPLRRLKAGAGTGGRLGDALRTLRASRYERVVDAQGLLKSGLVGRAARGVLLGPARGDIREPAAAVLLQRQVPMPRGQHAIERLRQLLAGALNYTKPPGPPDFGLRIGWKGAVAAPAVLLLHGTAWPTKRWPEAHWVELATRLATAGLRPLTTWGDSAERAVAERLQAAVPAVEVLERQPLGRLAETLCDCRAVVAADTGLAHLAAALGVPTLAVYGPTNPELTGVRGVRARHLASGYHCAPCLRRTCAEDPRGERAVWPPCLGELTPEAAWMALGEWLNRS